MMKKTKLRAYTLIVMATVFLPGCMYNKVDVHEMISDMKQIKSQKSAYINILWYNGSDEKFDYFGYVYSMTGTKLYKVPLGQLLLEKRFTLTDDDTKWLRINEIGDAWSASRLNLSNGIWVTDRKGVGSTINSDQK